MQKTDSRSTGNASESKLHFLDYWRIIRVRFGIVLLSFLLVVITAAVATYFQPRKYQSSVKLELQTEQNSQVSVFRESNGGMDPRLVTTQMEIMRSKNILYPVVDNLKLTSRWSSPGEMVTKEAAYYRLLRMLSLRPIRGTDFLELQVTSTDPKEAAELVNAVATSYTDAKRFVFRTRNDEDLEMINQKLNVQRERVKEYENKLTTFRSKHPEMHIAGTDTGASSNAVDPYEAQIASKQQEVDKFTTQIAGLKSQLSQVEQLKGQELLRAINTLQIPDATIQKVLPLYQDAVASEAALLQSGLGNNHPTVKAVRASKDVYTGQLTEQVASIKRSLGIQLEISESTLASVTKQLTDLRSDAGGKRSEINEYNQLRDDFQKAQGVLDALVLSTTKTDIQNIPTRPVIKWDIAEPASYPSSPRVALNMALGVLVGLLVGIGLAFFIEYLDTSVKTMDDVEAMLGVPVLAIIPKNIKLLHKCPSDVPDAEAYRILRTNIEFNRKSADANTISMVSGGPGEGKSTTLANLAFTCAQGGYSVLVVDADLRRPTQHKIFEISNEIGLTNYLTANMPLDDVIVSTRIENLYLLPSGILPSDAVGILNSQRMSDMISELKTRYDIVFFDSPPILGVSDGAVLASEVDQSIIVVQHRRFPRALLQRVKQSVSSVGGTILGVVLNNVDLRHDPSYAYYTSYYDYYSVRPAEESRQPVTAVGGKVAAGSSSSSRGPNRSDY